MLSVALRHGNHRGERYVAWESWTYKNSRNVDSDLYGVFLWGSREDRVIRALQDHSYTDVHDRPAPLNAEFAL
jgi:hypothetical protein